LNEEEMQKQVEAWADLLLKTDGTLDQNMVFRLCVEIERTTRQRIVSSLSAVANAVDSRIDIYEMLRKAT